MATSLSSASRSQPRGWSCEGDGRRQVRRRVRRAGSRLRRRRLQRDRARAHHRASMQRSAEAVAGRVPGLHAREPAGDGLRTQSQLARRDRASRLAVPAAVRRRDPFQRPARGAGRGRGFRAGALRRVARSDRVRKRAARHGSREPTRRRPTCPQAKRSGIDPPPSPRGNADDALAERPDQVRAGVPRRRSSTTTRWRRSRRRRFGKEDGKLTVYDKTQGVQNSRPI